MSSDGALKVVGVIGKTIGITAVAVVIVFIILLVLVDTEDMEEQTESKQDQAELAQDSKTGSTHWYDDDWDDNLGDEEDYGDVVRHPRHKRDRDDETDEERQKRREERRAEREKRRADRENGDRESRRADKDRHGRGRDEYHRDERKRSRERDEDVRGNRNQERRNKERATEETVEVSREKLETKFRTEADLKKFSTIVIANMNEVWEPIVKEKGKKFKAPKLHVFTDETTSECGDVDADTGPFYCSDDLGLYLDLTYFQEMKEELETDSDFAFAYVIAHEYGHHIQHLFGDLNKYSEREESLRERGKETKANLISVQTELQADFLAGVWAYHDTTLFDTISEDDIEQTLWSAASVGDDILGEERRESFSHGSAEMRLEWLARGMLSGDLQYGNTFQYNLNQLENPPEIPGLEDDDEEE